VRQNPKPTLVRYAHSSHGFAVAYSGVPYTRKFVGDAAIAESGVTTLDRVAVSDKKRGRDVYQMGKEHTAQRYFTGDSFGTTYHVLPRKRRAST
jgi:hypothetical protein